ncbi:MAG: hypothetical protein HLUCCA08_11150 [Rhodobacteraceae bacterium HLUCCA08]|nr:MAG: hypothetical protein HLUCCA08_11150 [Rhodobacteraceae bacterium HLUCCA08]
MPATRALVLAAAVICLAAAGWLVLREATDPGLAAHPVPGMGEMNAAELSRDGYLVIPAMLREVYVAFGATEEAVIHDTLAAVAAGPALETLYLDRAGAMAGGGLDGADQEIHEMELLDLASSRDGAMLSVNATWRVLGTVGHAEHMHVRGNVYSAALTLAPTAAGWRITGFELLDVDRSDAGTMVAAPEPAEATGG